MVRIWALRHSSRGGIIARPLANLMIKKPSSFAVLSLAAVTAACAGTAARAPSTAQAPAPSSQIAAKTAGLEKKDGFIPIYLDNKTGKILLEIPRDSMRVLMFIGQATGLG